MHFGNDLIGNGIEKIRVTSIQEGAVIQTLIFEGDY